MKVSVLIPVRSGWQYVRDAIDSALCQTHADLEVLVGVNGFGPRCRVLEQVTRWCQCGDPRLEVYDFRHLTNKPQTMNALKGYATGDVIACLDADDVWLPDKLEKQLPFLAEYDVVTTLGEYIGTHSGGMPIEPGELTLAKEIECNYVLQSSVVMRKELFGLPDTDLLDDYPTWLEMLAAGKRFYIVGEVLTKIRCHPEQWYADVRDNSTEIRNAWRSRVAVRSSDG